MSNYAKVVVGMSLGFALVAIDPWNIAHASNNQKTAKWQGTAANMSARCSFIGAVQPGQMVWDDTGKFFKTTDPAIATLKVNKAQKIRVVADDKLYEGVNEFTVDGVTMTTDYGYATTGVNSDAVQTKGFGAINTKTFNTGTSEVMLNNLKGGKIELRIAGKATPNSDNEIYAGVVYTVKHTVICEQ